MEDSTEIIYDLLDECQMLLASIVLEGVSEHSTNAGIMLAQIVQELGREDDMFEHEFDPANPAQNIASAVIPKKDVRTPIKFADIDPAVLSAVYSACDSAEDGSLEGWEIDLIESRIVEHHSNARKLSANDLEDTNDK